MPGFGKVLFDFLSPLYRSARYDRLRLVKAACLLHDVGWRAHPDYRSEVVFDISTQANLAGLTHAERVFLGLALLHRYKNSATGSRFAALFDLLPPEDRKRAEVLGKAMRFGAMFAGQTPQMMGTLRYFPKKHRLDLVLPAPCEVLYGEVAAARFAALGKALGAEVGLVLRR
jgi:exopolyphosphatase/guanosine-5'-triphosphate,3'-diphosphate pyrophosphatase